MHEKCFLPLILYQFKVKRGSTRTTENLLAIWTILCFHPNLLTKFTKATCLAEYHLYYLCATLWRQRIFEFYYQDKRILRLSKEFLSIFFVDLLCEILFSFVIILFYMLLCGGMLSRFTAGLLISSEHYASVTSVEALLFSISVGEEKLCV